MTGEELPVQLEDNDEHIAAIIMDSYTVMCVPHAVPCVLFVLRCGGCIIPPDSVCTGDPAFIWSLTRLTPGICYKEWFNRGNMVHVYPNLCCILPF